jgi:hypothetical protein
MNVLAASAVLAPCALSGTSPGPEAERLAQSVGSWNVRMTMQLSPDAQATVVDGVIAERKMIGEHLQEIMQPAPGSSVPAFQRIAYLLFNRIEGRWQYVSMDTRLPVGIMPAQSFDSGSPTRIELQFAPIAFPGTGPAVDGRMMRSNLILSRLDADHEVSEQFFIAADGTGRRWRAVQYDYTRRK